MTIPILLNITNRAGFGVEWTMPGSGGTTMQLVNPRGTHYLLFALRPHYSADWLTMGVVDPKRFGLHAPAATFESFAPVAKAFVAATDPQPNPERGHVGHPRIPCPRPTNQAHRTQSPARVTLAHLRPPRRMLDRFREHRTTNLAPAPGLHAPTPRGG